MTEQEAKSHMTETLNKLKDDNVARGEYLVAEDKRLTQILDYINNALNNPDRAYDERSGLPIYRSGTVTNQLLHSYPDTFCEKAVRFALPEYQRFAPLYQLTAAQLLISYLPTSLDRLATILSRISRISRTSSPKRAQRVKNTKPTANCQFSIVNCQLKRHRRDSIQSAIKSLQIYQHNYDLIAADSEAAMEFDLPINRLATMLDYIQFLDPTPDTHTNLFTFLKTLATEAKRMNHRQLRLHASQRAKPKTSAASKKH